MPRSFPESIQLIGVVETEGDGQGEDVRHVTINPNYRRYGNASNESFFYFINRILPAMNPTQSKFKQDKDKKLISEMFSVADEAFALVVLFNEYDVWEEQIIAEDEGRQPAKKKRFCDSKSGRRDGWKREGKNLFFKLCMEVEKLRSDPETGKELEEKVKYRLAGGCEEQDEEGNDESGQEPDIDIYKSANFVKMLAECDDDDHGDKDVTDIDSD